MSNNQVESMEADAFSDSDLNKNSEETRPVGDSSLELQRAEDNILKFVKRQVLHRQQETSTRRRGSPPPGPSAVAQEDQSDAEKYLNEEEASNPRYLAYLSGAINPNEFRKDQKFRDMTQLAIVDSKNTEIRVASPYSNEFTTNSNPLFVGRQQQGDNHNAGTEAMPTNIPPSTPGAFPYSFEGQRNGFDISGQFDDSSSESASATEQASTAISIEHTETSQRDQLAVANPIPELPIAQVAEEVLDKQDLEAKAKVNKSHEKKYALLAGFLLVAVAVVLIIVLLSAKSMGQEVTNSNQQDNNAASVEVTTPPLTPKEQVLLLLPEATTSKIQNDNNSAQAQALEWILDDHNLLEYPDWKKVQRFALATFFIATGGPGWYENTGWMNHDIDECDWYPGDTNLGFAAQMNSDAIESGLLDTLPNLNSSMCGGNQSSGRIEQMVFVTKELEGIIPDELYLLTDLKYFASIFNDLDATIPSTIGDLAHLASFFHAGGLKGSIPSEIGLVKNLQHLLVFRNELTGSFPTEMGGLGKLKAVMADENQLSGEIPSELGLLTDMIWWSTHSNNLSGRIPEEFFNCTSLRMLALFENLHTGSVPSQVGFLTAVKDLTWRHNLFSGFIPTQVSGLSSLQEWNMKENHLTGSLPTQIGMLTSLSGIGLAFNKLTGALPSEFGIMESIVYIDLEHNQFEGGIPTEVGALKLGRFDLFSNRLNGTIPTQLGFLTTLPSLRLEHNQLTGTIPLELELLRVNGSLTIFNVGNTTLSGTIPEGLCSLGEWEEPQGRPTQGLYFDCSDQLCGCCWCPCSNVSINTCQR